MRSILMVALLRAGAFLSLPGFGEGRVGFLLTYHRCAGGAPPDRASRGHPPRKRGGTENYIPIALRRLSDTLSRKAVVESHFWSAPISSARSLVMSPASTVSTQTFSSVCANLASSALPSSLARWESPRVQAKIEAIELVEVSRPFWCSR